MAILVGPFSNFKSVYLSGFAYAISILSLLCFFCSLSNGRLDDSYQLAIKYSHDYLKTYIKKTGTIGLAVAVIDSDKVVYSEEFGYADKDEKIVVTDSTTFMIGSITKLFTATAIMQLVEQEKIVLDSPVIKYLPEFSIKSSFSSRPITVRDLLTHESGVPSLIQNGADISQVPCMEADTMYRAVPALIKKEFAIYPPGTMISYSNTGFSLLGVIAEKVSGLKYSRYIEENIFNKLNMEHSSFDFNNSRNKHLFSKCYANGKEEYPFYVRDLPAAMLVTSISDLSQFLKMLFANGNFTGQHILDSSTLHSMWEPQNRDVPIDFDTIGLAYRLYNPTQIPLKIIQHGGQINSFAAFLAGIPDIKMGVIVFLNSWPYDEQSIAAKLLEIFYEAKTGLKLEVEKKINTQVNTTLSAKRLEELAGLYQTSFEPMEIKLQGNNLSMFFLDETVIFVPQSDSTFSGQHSEYGKIVMQTHTINNSNIIVLSSKKLQPPIIGERYEPEVPMEEWINRAGIYEVVNEHKIIFANKSLEKNNKMDYRTLSYSASSKSLVFDGRQLKTITPTEAIFRGIGENVSVLQACMGNGKEYLWYSGYALKKVK